MFSILLICCYLLMVFSRLNKTGRSFAQRCSMLPLVICLCACGSSTNSWYITASSKSIRASTRTSSSTAKFSSSRSVCLSRHSCVLCLLKCLQTLRGRCVVEVFLKLWITSGANNIQETSDCGSTSAHGYQWRH